MTKHTPYFMVLSFALWGSLLSALLGPAVASAGTGTDEFIVDGKFRVVTEEELAARRLHFPSGTRRGTLISETIPDQGTGYAETIEYQVPSGYSGQSPIPMIVCWHGYSMTCHSVASMSNIDEECEQRCWFFLSITGAHENNYGFLPAQENCTIAIDHVINTLGYNIDTDRIYMAGLSMGAGAAASYACRHMHSSEGYPIAGLIVVAGSFAWDYVYTQGDPAATTWLPILLNGTPAEKPFAYRQISTLNIFHDTYVKDYSMGQNLAHNMPVFITYAGNDPLPYGVTQNRILTEMLSDLDANTYIDYYDVSFNPHHWLLLDVETAFDYIEDYDLKDQTTNSVELLIDRSARFYWADVTQFAVDTFTIFDSHITLNTLANTLVVTGITNAIALGVDCDWLGLNQNKNLIIDYRSIDFLEQDLILQPMSSEPTYAVDEDGKLCDNYSYDAVEDSITFEFTEFPVNEYLKASYEEYNLTLDVPATGNLNEILPIQFSGGDPYDPYLLLIGIYQVETKVGIHHILVSPLFPTIMIFFGLDAQGECYLPPRIPDDPGLVGITGYMQFLTFDTQIKEKSNMTATLIEE
ncbi:MAG: hypothetical protein ABIK28_06210 [Planctomycetota bacterium]